MSSQKPILVTGSFRSGSTWVGKILTQSPEVGYIHEPFNREPRPGLCSVPFVNWLTYVSEQDSCEPTYYKSIHKTIHYSFDFWGGLQTISQSKRKSTDALRYLKTGYDFLSYRLAGARPLIKDPMAIFSSEWLANKFDMDVVVLIRHPAAFAGSAKRTKFLKFYFEDLLKQPLLMQDYLYPFEAEIKKYASESHDKLDQAALCWKLIHHVILEYQKKYKNWIFIRHEDLSRDPMNRFQEIFNKLDLQFSEQNKQEIQASTSASNPVEPPQNSFNFFNRDSKGNIWSWQERLTPAEIEKLREQVEDVSASFYSDEDWEGPKDKPAQATTSLEKD